MKSTFAGALALLLAHASAHAAPDPGHQWIELSLPHRHAFCDLARATRITIAGDRVTAENSFPSATGTNTAFILFEDDLTAAQAVLKAVQERPEQWIPYETGLPQMLGFVNAAEIASVTFGADGRGEFAQIISRTDSVMSRDIAARSESAGYSVRAPQPMERLKALVGSR